MEKKAIRVLNCRFVLDERKAIRVLNWSFVVVFCPYIFLCWLFIVG